jgi:hypothetical protein
MSQEMLIASFSLQVCCAGVWPCCGFETPKPECCLICEAAFCCPLAVSGNRFMTQTRLNVKNKGCVDSIAVKLHCCVDIGCSCARICFECSEERENIVKSSICVLPASLCQNAAEMNYFTETNQRYLGPPRGVIEELPVHFHNAGVVVARRPTQQTMKQ